MSASMKSLFPVALGVVMIGGLVFAGVKVRHIQQLRREISRVEKELSAGQRLWRRYPPLQAAERRRLEENQAHLLRKLPENKDMPDLLEEISRIAQEHHLSDVAFSTEELGSTNSPTTIAATKKPPTVTTAGPAGPIAWAPLRFSFAGDYREISYFFTDVQKLPRIVQVESVSFHRSVPLVQTEVSWKAFYRNGDLGDLVE